MLVGAGTPGELATRLADLGPVQTVVKLGERGCVARIDGVDYAADAIPITPLDTVGAGDAFVAGYLTALLDDRSPAERLDLAVRCGAFACLGPGDWESLPRRADLDAAPASDPVAR
jgi:2-dehydro-3-deoxygluconokinase